MKEPVIVDHAQLAPYACKCGNTTGPLIDTFFQDAEGRVYVCKRCSRSYARAFGFAPGKKLDELADAANVLEQRDREFAVVQAELGESRLEVDSAARVISSLREQLESTQAQVQTARFMASGLAQTASDLVSATTPAAAEAVAA